MISLGMRRVELNWEYDEIDILLALELPFDFIKFTISKHTKHLETLYLFIINLFISHLNVIPNNWPVLKYPPKAT